MSEKPVSAHEYAARLMEDEAAVIREDDDDLDWGDLPKELEDIAGKVREMEGINGSS